MQEIIKAVQWINVIMIIAECDIVVKKMQNRLHAYLCLNCVSMLICSLSYLMMLYCTSEEGFFVTTLISWGGKIFGVIAMLHLSIELCSYKLPKPIEAAELLLAGVTYVVILTTGVTGLFYSHFGIINEDGWVLADAQKGPWYYIWDLIVLSVVVSCLLMYFKSSKSETGIQKKKLYKMLIISLTLEIIIGMLTFLPASRYYDFNQLGFSLCSIIFLIAIFKYNIMDLETITRDYIVDELSAGVIALNGNCKVAYYNRIALKVFPQIQNDACSVTELIGRSISTSEPVRIDDRTYTFEEKTLQYGMQDSVRIYVIIDSTMQYRHIKEIEDASYVDSLTGLKNRRSYDRILAEDERGGNEGDNKIANTSGNDNENNGGNKDQNNCENKGLYKGAVFCDLNSLKFINDNYGHVEGDRYITGFAKMLADMFADGEVCRISGDEFVVILKGITKSDMDRRMQELRSAIDAHDRIAAFGWAFGSGNLLELVREAEKEMYKDKSDYYVQTGKDRRK